MKVNKKVLLLTTLLISGGMNAAENIDRLLNKTLTPHALAALRALQNEFTDYQAIAQIDDSKEEEHLFACSYKDCGQTFHDQKATVAHIKEKHGTGAKAISKKVWKALEAMQEVSDKDESSSYAELNQDSDDSEDSSTSGVVIQKKQKTALVSASYIAPKKEITGTGQFECDICGGRFTRPFTLREHRRSHTGKRPFKCSTCGETFARRFTLKRHEETHTGKKHFACNLCPAKFQTKDHLERHTTSHTGEKQFPCQVCGRPFAVRYSLTRHMETVHKKPTAEK